MACQRFCEETLGGRQIPVFTEPELDGVVDAFDGAIEVHPSPADLDVGSLIDRQRPVSLSLSFRSHPIWRFISASKAPAPERSHSRCIGSHVNQSGNPVVARNERPGDGSLMIDTNATLRHHFSKVA